VVGLVALLGSLGCARALSGFFDLPSGDDKKPVAVPRAAATEVEVAAPPPIESVLDRKQSRELLPDDSMGGVDWVAALREGLIRPRPGLPGDKPPPDLTGFRYDMVFESDDPEYAASFPHSSHVEWVDCLSCHPKIFPSGHTPITMDAIDEGELCGRCHSQVAFSSETCHRCHFNTEPETDDTKHDFMGDIVLARGQPGGDVTDPEDLPLSRFPHWIHRIRYQCRACHPGLFDMRAGAAVITMAEMSAGKSCGRCHNGRDAFRAQVDNCDRCHYQGSPGGSSSP